MIMVGTAALFWVILRYRNDLIFENCKYSFFTQTVFRGRLDTFLGAVGEWWEDKWILSNGQQNNGETMAELQQRSRGTNLANYAPNGRKQYQN
jgi:hypothetical protein